MQSSWFWMAALLAVTVYCLAQAIRDFRAKRYAWATAAACSSALLLTMPFPTHAVKIDLPAVSQP